VGTGGDLEHGAAMIHPRLGMAMRRTIRRGRVIVPGHAKVGPPGSTIDLLYGPLDAGWDLDAVDSTPVLIHDAPRPDEIVLWIGYGSGPRVNARSKGPDQKEVDALIASFNNGTLQWRSDPKSPPLAQGAVDYFTEPDKTCVGFEYKNVSMPGRGPERYLVCEATRTIQHSNSLPRSQDFYLDAGTMFMEYEPPAGTGFVQYYYAAVSK